ITKPCWQLAAFIANCIKVNFQKKPSKPKRASSLTGALFALSQGWCYSEKRKRRSLYGLEGEVDGQRTIRE
ncbi:hypothetical protein B1O53_16055, partial [Listeria monocytogenes]|nr:hypothetical protein [Listeria monocytogenes]